MKLPAFQFYPADWRKDPGVQSLSFNDRGIWFEILCLMHESSDRGKLTLRGQPMPEDALARLLGLDKQNLTKALTTLLEYGVASRCPDTGALVCRRMIRDEEIRRKRTEAGKLGGNPTLTGKRPTKVVKQTVNQKTTPSSSSSSSPSGNNKEREGKGAPTLKEAIAAGLEQGIPDYVTTVWWEARETNGWLKGTQGGGQTPVVNWRTDLSRSRTWAEEEYSKSKNHRQAKSATEYPEPKQSLPRL